MSIAMNAAALPTLSSASPSFLPLKTHSPPSALPSAPVKRHSSSSRLTVRVSSKYSPVPNSNLNDKSIVQKFKSLAKTAVLVAAASLVIGRFSHLTAKAETPVAITEENPVLQEEEEQEKTQNHENASPLSEFLESNSEAFEALKSMLQQKLENGEDEEALKILNRLVSAQPEVTEWKFFLARVLNELGKTDDARKVFEEILKTNPLSFEALFENALLMDRCGEGEAVIKRLEEALAIAEEENKVEEARDVRLIMAQILFLQKNVDEALKSYQELAKEDPNDFRPYFCQGMIYSLLDRNAEAKEQFAKYRELSPRKFEVEGYLRTPLSRMKLFSTNEEN